MLLTFQDAVESLIDYQGAEPSDTVLRDAKKACIESLREIAAAHVWTYLYKQGRIVTTQPYCQGTVAFQATGGAYPNMLTLTGGTWPTWACWGTVRIWDSNFEVDRRISGSVVTLRPPLVPYETFAGATYGLYQVAYPMPLDFMSQDVTFLKQDFGGMSFVHPREWLMESVNWAVMGDPIIFTLMADKHTPNGMAMYVAPFPNCQWPIDFIYKRHLAPVDVFRACTGTVSTAAGYPNVTALGANFTPNMACHCVLRVSGVPKCLPTNETGPNPAVWESKITAVPTSQQLVTLDPAPVSLVNMPYTISSYIDVEHVMEQAYKRRCEYQICVGRKAKNKDAAYADYKLALASAKSADYRNSFPRTAGCPTSVRKRLKDYPIVLSRES
jgi:hypothetical protein